MHEPQPIGAAASSGRRLARWCLASYWVLLVLATHWPKAFLPEEGRLVPSDKRLHFFAYFGLAGLLVLVLARSNGQSRRSDRRGWPIWAWSLTALAIAVAFGLIDEATQPWTGREFDWADWWADIYGATAGAAAVAALMWLRGRLSAATEAARS